MTLRDVGIIVVIKYGIVIAALVTTLFYVLSYYIKHKDDQK